MDPFEFVRESHVSATVNGKSIYSIRKNIGKEQADFLATKINIDYAYAEPDYTRPMTQGFSLEYQRYSKMFEISEGIIKDRYDDSDHMIDFSEQVSKNKLLTTGKSLKFVIQSLVQNKKVATIQGSYPNRQYNERNHLLFTEGRSKTNLCNCEFCSYNPMEDKLDFIPETEI